MIKKTNKRWIVGTLLFFATSINYLDRSVLGIAGPSMMKDLQFNEAQFGLLASAFFWTYALMQIPVGAVVDRFGAKLTYAVAIICWSICTILTGVVRSFGLLIGARALMGVGESPSFPTNTRVISDWFPSRERGTANALLTAGIAVGAGLLTPVIAYTIERFGWQYSFFLCGAIGIIYTIVWLGFYKNNPADHPGVNEAELAYINEGKKIDINIKTENEVVNRVRWYQLLKYKAIWCLLFGYFAQNYVLYLMLTWLPTYLVMERQMTLLKAGFNAIIPWIASALGAFIGGHLSDYFIQRGMQPLIARRTVMAIGMFFSVSIIFAGFVDNAMFALILISVALGGSALAGACVWATIADIAPRHLVGTAAGIQGLFGNLAGWIAPVLTGMFVLKFNSFILPLIVSGVISGVAAILYVIMLRKTTVQEILQLNS